MTTPNPAPAARRGRLPRPLGILLAFVVGIAPILAACGSNPAPTASAPASASIAPTSPAGSGPAGSGGAAASAQPSQDAAAIYKAIEGQVSKLRSLAQRSPVDPKVLDAAGMKAYVEAEFAKESPADRLAADERLGKLLGLLPADASLLQLNKDLLTSQVVGLYSPDDKAMYVLQTSGGIGPSERTIFAHEFTHALQDQQFDLVAYGKLTEDRTQGDRALARMALVEGDATAVMSLWAQSNLTIEELMRVAREASDPAASAIMAKMPVLIRETSLFPYGNGATFVLGLQVSGGWAAVDRAFADPPETTEQVMHVAKYTAREKAIPVAVPEGLAGRMGTGWSVGTQDTLGEFQLSIWLGGASGAVSPAAATAAAGWGGDRIVLLDGPNGARGAALLTAWDTAQDASEFAMAATAAIDSFKLNALVVYQPGQATVTVLVGSDDATTSRLHQILGVSGV